MINCLELLREKGIEPKKVAMTNGGEYHSPCPRCGGRDRFHTWPAEKGGDGTWWCRQCEKGGDSITFVMEFDGLSYPEACRQLGKDLPPREPCQRPRPPASRSLETWDPAAEDPPPPELWQEKADRFLSWSKEKLEGNQERRNWLKSRGITIQAIRRHQLGWNPGDKHKDLWRPRETWGLATIMKGRRKKRLWLPRGLVIPCFQDGRVIRIRIRTLTGRPPYYVLPGSSMNPMVLESLESRAFLLVESELDGIAVTEGCGDIITVIALGSVSTRPSKLLAAALAKAIVILFALDYDEAGNAALAWWKKQYPQVKAWRVPVGKDPGEAFEKGVNLKEWVMEGLPTGLFGPFLTDQKQRTAPKSHKPTPEEGRGDVPPAVAELAELLKRHPVSIRVTPNRTYIREKPAWARSHWETSRRISELVFQTSEVLDWLDQGCDAFIDGDNILEFGGC